MHTTVWRTEGMSSQYAIALILVVFPLNLVVYHLVDRWFQQSTEAIATGVSRGVSVSVWYRWMRLQISWVGVVGGQISLLVVVSAGWLLFGRSTSDEEVRLLAYACAFMAFMAAVGWTAVCPFWYIRLAKTLRQAEAD